MDWTKLLYVLVIALLYVPMVFLGANVFFPKYTGSEGYFQPSENCYGSYPPSEKLTAVEQQQISEEQRKTENECNARMRAEEKVWNEARNEYNGWKYAAITGFNLIILLIAALVPWMEAVRMGIFFGAVVTAFGATVSYWEYARTKIGFGLMLIVFFVVLWFINKWAKRAVKKKR
ncbi:hypothetical protein HY493_01450 [Candidatus Woesearchaeota archaeon]|nr:hypothetical protein [Candidatus Woesearchaeota archaeon]